MDEQLQEVMVEGGEEILGWLRTSGEFAAEQAPLLAQEIVRYGLWWHGAGAVLFMGLTLVAARVTLGLYDWAAKNDEEELGILAWIFGIAITVGLSVPVFVNLAFVLKAVLWPRLYIIEYMTGLVG